MKSRLDRAKNGSDLLGPVIESEFSSLFPLVDVEVRIAAPKSAKISLQGIS